MKNYFTLSVLTIVIVCCSSARQSAAHSIVNKSSTPDKNIGIIELRNYLVKSNQADTFNTLFSNHFLNSMQEMGVSILGKYKIKNNGDHFVWVRGYQTMAQRVKFLNDYYYRNEEWKKYKKEANGLIRNSDNVYLLQPLKVIDGAAQENPSINSNEFKGDHAFVTVDFYIANTRLKELTAFYTNEYLPILKSAAVETTLWTSVMADNDFPQLPVFQDKNLLVAISFYDSESDYKKKNKLLNKGINEAFKAKMADIVTTHNQIVLNKF